MDQIDPASRELAGTALAAVAPFAVLPAAARDELVGQSRTRIVSARHLLFRQGDAADALYVVVSGRLEVVRERPSPAAVLRRLGRGDVVGELALLTDAPRSATVRAVRDSVMLELDRNCFDDVLRRSPELSVALLRRLGRLLQTASLTDHGAPERIGVLALVPLSPNVPTERLAEELEQRLGGRSAVARLDVGVAGEVHTEHGLAARLDGVERERRHVLLLADGSRPLQDEWNAFCLRQADQVVALAAVADEPPAPGALTDCHLVVSGVAADSERAAYWLHAVKPRTLQCLADGADVDTLLRRAARRILGRSVGLVLSGGGAGALAHIGVIEALLDAGVRIDRVGGCSMGALVGGMYAMGREPDDMAAACHRELVRGNPLRDLPITRQALTRGRKWKLLLRRIFGDQRVETLPLDFFAVSADLRSAELVVHREGPLSLAVGVSMALPGLVPPQPVDGRLLVDGGVLDNLPIDVMAERPEGPIVAVDAMRSRFDELSAPPGGRAVPSLLEILPRVTVLAGWRAAQQHRRLARVVIAPRLPDAGMLDFKRLPDMVLAGRMAAEEALSDGALAGLN